MEASIQKGSRIRAKWFSLNPNASLAGMQLKSAASLHEVIGTVRHMRTNDPMWAPENVVVFVSPDSGDMGEMCDRCGVKEVQVKVAWIKEIL